MKIKECEVSIEGQGVLSKTDHPEPFNDGEYLHYTRFHPQLKDMIGAVGYFYDEDPSNMSKQTLIEVDYDGCPVSATSSWAYFAVPIKLEKTELTPQEVADKFGVPVEQLRIKE